MDGVLYEGLGLGDGKKFTAPKPIPLWVWIVTPRDLIYSLKKKKCNN